VTNLLCRQKEGVYDARVKDPNRKFRFRITEWNFLIG